MDYMRMTKLCGVQFLEETPTITNGIYLKRVYFRGWTYEMLRIMHKDTKFDTPMEYYPNTNCLYGIHFLRLYVDMRIKFLELRYWKCCNRITI